MLTILIVTIIKNRRNVIKVALRSLFLFNVMFIGPYFGDANSEVIRSVIALTTINKLKSEKFKGRVCIFYTSSI